VSQSLWDFSLAVYGRPGVAPALIGLQDRLGLDVNMLLFCCWAAARGQRLAATDLAAVEAVCEPWQAEVVGPLRKLRRRLKEGFASLPADQVESYRKHVNDLEIEGERIAQTAMQAALLKIAPRPAATGPALAAGNLKAYVGRQRKSLAAGDRTALARVVGACFPEAAAGEISAALA
jgi:uncharacterized protein (TIGR02444 family)